MFYFVLNKKGIFHNLFIVFSYRIFMMPVSAEKKLELKNEINLLVKIASKLLLDDKSLFIGKDQSPRNIGSIWQKICFLYIGKNCFTQASRIKKLWVNNTENFASEIEIFIKKVNRKQNNKMISF